MAEPTVQCIDCDSKVDMNELPEIGAIITCDECGSEMEITNTDPIEVDYAPDEPSGW